MPWFAIMTVFAIALAVSGLISLVKLLTGYFNKTHE